MRIPTVHLNGTGGLELFDQVTFASLAVGHAIDKLQAAWPNARDYYVQEGMAWKETIYEWGSRADRLIESRGSWSRSRMAS